MAVRRATGVAGAYAVVVGSLMAAMWVFFLVTGQVPELDERPAEIILHLAAEFLTALALIAGGLAVRFGRPRGVRMLLVGLGMLLYTVIVSPGYYVSRGEAGIVVMFALLLVLTLVCIAGVMRAETRTLG